MMNFNFGEVLARAWQITWKHKSLWLAGILVALVGLAASAISLAFNPQYASMNDPAEVSRQLPLILLSSAASIFISLLSIPLTVLAMTIPSLGTVHLERGSERVRFGELLKGSLPYFWRILAIFLIVIVGTIIVTMVLVGCIMLLSVLTFGVGALCAVPVVILFIPVWILVYAVMEQALSAIVVDNLGFSAALQRAWDLVRANMLVMVLISLIIYLGSAILSMIVSIPLMIPIFGFMMEIIRTGGQTQPDPQLIQDFTRNLVWWMLAFSPLFAIFQGIVYAFMQSAWTLTYMRLTRPQGNAPVIIEANA
jgi:hypothetical protein